MSSNISNTFGFNMGVKMGDFGIVESNTPPVPPLPQPKYITLWVRAVDVPEPTVEYETVVNTSTGVINHVDSLSNIYYSVSFDTPYCTNVNNVYIEAYFEKTWFYATDESVPVFSAKAQGDSTIIITAVNYDNTKVLVDGYITLQVTIFEI